MTLVETERNGLDAVDRRILVATQGGLPLVPRPYHALADRLDIAPEEIMRRMRRLLECGVIRRIAAVPDHYALGYRANGMSVWDVDDARVDELGREVGALPFVSHCYRRPRVLPDWPYNLFAMLHAATRLEIAERVAAIASLLGDAARSYDILFSTRILKKTGMRLGSGRGV
jgi:DNA-binding Lrp family transcriptional regulator